ncbi:hypothetical protein EV702DRAFT_1195206 [Suillus placidus]|uniref:Uncharacterized protein n=1 Tax=Suillus placidus TaxID=48579 RepID=A0A9P6ZZT2_9AGAM|nr:hypothetical protein EV702DRAFT_1195206 [Suillus placidus]
MHSPSVPVAPFYEPEGPPEALPLLTYHTEMFCPTTTSISISWQEEIVFFPLTPILSRPPTPKVAKAVSFSAEQISQASIGSSLSSIASHESKIPKPDGEAGRPSRGGYNLEIALKWDAGRFKAFKECVHASIQKHCDTSKSKTSQTPAAIVAVQTENSMIMMAVGQLEIYSDAAEKHRCEAATKEYITQITY